MAILPDASARNGKNNGSDGRNEAIRLELDRLAQFFPDGTRVKIPVHVTRLGSSEEISTVLEYGTSHDVIFRSALPMEFGDRIRLTNRDGSLNAEAEVTAVQIGSETFVAARFTAEVPNWIIKA